MSLSEWELWACANEVLEAHGTHAPVYVAIQIGGLARRGDGEGILAWQEIAKRIEQLQGGADCSLN